MPGSLLDTSAAVPLVVAGHEAHERTLDALEGRTLGLAGHAWFETLSVLTRLPPPARRTADEVTSILRHNFPLTCFLSPVAAETLAGQLPELGVDGGAVYDALVGAAAIENDMPLVSRDARAVELYRLLGVTVEQLR